MADPKKSRKNQADEPEVKSKSKQKPKPKAKKPATEPTVKVGPVLSPSQKAKAVRIARQQEATEHNRELRSLGQRTPFEQMKLERKIARDRDPIIRQRKQRRVNDQQRAENARILAKADAEAKAATETIQKVHAKSGV